MSGYCATCNNTGSIDCHCGGDLCVCGEEEIECPECGGGFVEDDDYDAIDWSNPSVIPCKRGENCNWPACSLECDGRPGRSLTAAEGRQK